LAKYLNDQGLAHMLAGLWARVNQKLSAISLTPGPPGAKGDKGDTGATGATGAQGLHGNPGNTGATGPQGNTGNTGATGATGAKGIAFYGWSTAANLTNISSVSGMAVGDFVVNTGAATRTILGVSCEIGGVVQSTSATAGTAAGSIRGVAGATGQTGATGSQGPQGNPGATGATGAAGAKGTSFYGWSTAANLTNISSISGMVIGDYVVNNTTATRTILGVSTGIGGVVRSTSATAGTAAGNIMGYTPPTTGPFANMTLTEVVAYLNNLCNGVQTPITLNVNTVRVVVP